MYASPIVVVAKSKGECTDYRALNKITEFDNYPTPRIDQILDEVADAVFITNLDLTEWRRQQRDRLRRNVGSLERLDEIVEEHTV